MQTLQQKAEGSANNNKKRSVEEAVLDDVPAVERAQMVVITRTVAAKSLEGELIDLQAAAKSMSESALNKSCKKNKTWKKW